MALHRLIYASYVAPGLNAAEIDEIMAASARNNKKRFVTGALAFDRKYFLQCLEGEHQAINDLYNVVIRDERHHSVVLLDFRMVERRAFNSWMMPYAGSTEANSRIFFRYSGTDQFEPLTMSGGCAFGLLQELEQANAHPNSSDGGA
ncbi:BLUF domain-containing protein [Marinobacter sediminum]|uniref:BLUF domain-containing protein n=1 Tax=Marinobacter sediminum TaxID=256323 RepID=UPI00193972F3|nr:BLUF domain-containing protein [Marinobacter sediminum]